jgi:hypothetical protein
LEPLFPLNCLFRLYPEAIMFKEGQHCSTSTT